jgi:hypothetical protein
MTASLIQEYIVNMHALLAQNETLYGLMVERQIATRLLPRVRGTRAELEADLSALLQFCSPRFPRAAEQVAGLLVELRTEGKI